jgi:hypothetical protein
MGKGYGGGVGQPQKVAPPKIAPWKGGGMFKIPTSHKRLAGNFGNGSKELNWSRYPIINYEDKINEKKEHRRDESRLCGKLIGWESGVKTPCGFLGV